VHFVPNFWVWGDSALAPLLDAAEKGLGKKHRGGDASDGAKPG